MAGFSDQVFPQGTVAVIFANQRTDADEAGYAAAAEAMDAAARAFPGYVGAHSTRGADGFGITVSYWRDDAAARAWKAEAEHSLIRETGRARWYRSYDLIVCEVTRSYAWAPPDRE